MENITLGQIAATIAIITRFWRFADKVIKGVNTALDAKLDPLEKKINMSLNAQFQMINHMVDGNHIDKLKALRDNMQQELIGDK